MSATVSRSCLLTAAALLLSAGAKGTPHDSDAGAAGMGAPTASAADRPIPIYVGGFFAYPDNPIFGALPATVQRAIDHVNNLTGILDGYQLNMRYKLTNGQSNEALSLLNDLLYDGPPVLMTWGPILSRQALVVNEVAPHYDLVQVCLANSQALRNRGRYPLTVQMYWSEDSINPARVAFVRHMGWTKVAIIFEDTEYFRENAEDLRSRLEASNISVITTEAISDTNSPDQQLKSLKRHDARIIFSLVYFDSAIKLFCKVYRMGMFGAKYVWTLVGWYPQRWWEAGDGGCTSDQLLRALENHLSLPAWRSVDDVQEIHYGHIKPPEHQLDFIRGLLAREGVDRLEHIESYDVLITMAMALNRSIEKLARLRPPRALHTFAYADRETASALLESVYEARFVGPTGSVVIEDGGFRSESKVRFFISQFQDGKSKEVIEYEKYSGTFRPIENMRFYWRGTSPPVDGVTILSQQVAVSPPVRVVLYIFASVGIILDLCFLIINIKFRNERAIKISTPPLNNLIVLGSLMLYASVFVFGLNESDFTENAIIRLCYIKLCLVCVGISLAFGALFMKTYRIHAIFSRAVAKFKRVDLPNYKLILGVFLAVAADIVVFATWIFFGETYVDKTETEPALDATQPDREIYVIHFIPFCTSRYLEYFMGAIYLTKGFLLAFGIFLAWETRTITVSSLNDSKYIGMSIYTVALLLAIVMPLLSLDVVKHDVTVNFAVQGAAIIITNTTVMCLVFLPKIYLLHTSTGRKKFHVSMMAKYLTDSSVTTNSNCAVATGIALQEKLQHKETHLQRLKYRLAILVSSTAKWAEKERSKEIVG